MRVIKFSGRQKSFSAILLHFRITKSAFRNCQCDHWFEATHNFKITNERFYSSLPTNRSSSNKHQKLSVESIILLSQAFQVIWSVFFCEENEHLQRRKIGTGRGLPLGTGGTRGDTGRRSWFQDKQFWTVVLLHMGAAHIHLGQHSPWTDFVLLLPMVFRKQSKAFFMVV